MGRRAAIGVTIVAVGARIVAALVLLFSPWTDDPAELSGWDIERFVAIATNPGTPWRDHAVEYPPGSVALFETLVGAADRLGLSDLVGSHRLLVAATLLADLALAWWMSRRSKRVAVGYLVLGLPLVLMGLVRLDLFVVFMGAAAALLTFGPDDERSTNSSPTITMALASALTAAGALTKVWPALLVPALLGLRRYRTATTTVLIAAVTGFSWLWWADSGLDPVRQITDLRGATGWHVESLPGALVALFSDDEPTLQLNAFRIGTLAPTLVTVGRCLAIAAAAALAWRVRGAVRVAPRLALFSAAVLGSVAALVVTAPLLSPQFLLWLTPWAAFMLLGNSGRLPRPVILTGLATGLTGVTLAAFGPSGMADPVAALAMTGRNLILIWIVVSCWRWLGSTARAGLD